MGATTFFDYSEGPTIDHAYRRAVDKAYYNHGHEGYTGTICEKDGWVLIPRPPRVSAEKVEETLDLAYQAWAWDRTPGPERRWMTKPTAGERACWRKVQKWWGSPGYRVGYVSEVMDAYNDKWGPALVISTTGADKARHARRTSSPVNDATRPRGHQLYAFFGWASA